MLSSTIITSTHLITTPTTSTCCESGITYYTTTFINLYWCRYIRIIISGIHNYNIVRIIVIVILLFIMSTITTMTMMSTFNNTITLFISFTSNSTYTFSSCKISRYLFDPSKPYQQTDEMRCYNQQVCHIRHHWNEQCTSNYFISIEATDAQKEV
jgi:hypothetical protein